MEFLTLGSLAVRDNGRALDLGGAKQRLLLAALLLDANRVVSRGRLMEAVWDERPPQTAAKALQVHVSQLRRALGERLVTQAPGYLLRIAPGELDADRAAALLERARNEPPQEAVQTLREALALWRGPPLADCAGERFAQAEIGRLEELRLTCLEQRIWADLACGRHAELVAELEALVAEQPLREKLREQLMLALYRSGRQAEALEVYQQGRRMLVEELGLEPGRRLRALEQAILRQDASLELAPQPPSERAVETQRGIFVGRERELGELVAALEAAVAGEGRLVLLIGEPGIGKSRLAEEAARHARERGARVLVGRCWEAGGAPAYWPWVQSLRAYVRESKPEALRAQVGAGAGDLVQMLPELRELIPDLHESPPLDPDGARFRLFDATAEFLRNASMAQPILLALDDLHAADTPSLLLLQFLARELPSSRLLVVGALRDVHPLPSQPLRELLAELAREPVTRRLSLAGLSEREVAAYVEQTAAELATPELVAALQAETEGNPLFVAESVRLLALEGVRPARGERIAIPQSVRDVIARRLAHLSEPCHHTLVFASVLGREFEQGALAALSGDAEDELLEQLDEALAARVLTDVPGSPGRLRFAHVLMRDTLYESLTTPRRVGLHRRAVETLEVLYRGEPGPHLAELAHHAISGSDFEKGLDYARRAGDRALALLAYEEAARLYRTALGALELSRREDEHARCALLLSLGEAESATDRKAAQTAFLSAAEIAQRLDLPDELARAAAGYGGRISIARAGEDEHLVPLLEDALARLPPDAVEWQVRLLARLAGALRDEPARERRTALSTEAVELARRAESPAALVYALAGRVSTILSPDTVVESLAVATELRDLARSIGDRERLAWAYLDRFNALGLLGRVDEARAELEQTSRLAHELRLPTVVWQARGAQALLALAEGRLGDAAELIDEAFALGRRAQPEMAIPIYHLQRYTLCEFRGRVEEARDGIAELVARYPARPVFRCALALLHVRVADAPDPRPTLEAMVAQNCAALPFDQEWLLGMALLAEAAAQLRDRRSARVLSRLLAPWRELVAADHPESVRGSVARYLGLLATTLERWDEAEHYFEAAVALNERTGFRPWLAHTQRDYANMLQARRQAEDAARARDLLAQAVAAYRELGMETYAREAAAQ